MELCAADAGVERLVEHYGERAYRLAWRITGATDEAEAVTQNALMRAVRSIQSIDDEAAFAGVAGRSDLLKYISEERLLAA